MKRPFLIYPFFFALFPVLSLFSHNVGEVSVTEMLLPALALWTLTTILLGLFRLILGDIRKAAILTAVFLVLSMSYMHVYQSIDWEIAGFLIGRHRNLMPIWIILFGCCTYFIRRTQRNLIDFTKILNVLGLVLVMIPLVTIGSHKFKTNNNMWDPKAMEDIGTEQQLSVNPKNLRDIYYIILDRYTDADTLKRVWDFDNKEFLDYLTNRGFYVAAESRSNYLKTAHSLASSLNVQLINFLGKQVGGESDDWLPLYQMLQDYKVQRFLKKKGYKYLHFGSWWGPTSENIHADMNFKLRRLPEFSSTLFRSTIFFPVAIGLGMFDHREEIRKRVLYKFDALGKIPEMNEPTFVFAHMIIPHPPYVFDRHGNYLTETQVNKRSRKKNHIDQLIFTNMKIKALIDKLLLDSKIEPIIILQADEGTFPKRCIDEWPSFNWERATEAELKEKMGILNAYYFPNRTKDVLYPTITPVNSFRLVFNLYFSTNLELLPDKSYAFIDENHLYSFFNVTDKVTDGQTNYHFMK
jgi:hypothetical protein